MSFPNFFPKTYNDKALLTALKNRGIPYTVDDQGMIDILPDENGSYGFRGIHISEHYTKVHLKSLRTSGAIFMTNGKISDVRLDALETMHGDLYAPNATSRFSAGKLRHLHANLVVNQATTVTMNALETVEGNLRAPNASDFNAEKLKYVGGDIQAPKATDFFANALEVTNGIINIPSAIFIDLAALRESGDIITSDQSAPLSESLLFSEQPLLGKNRSIFNCNTNLVKADTKPWMPIEELEGMMNEIHSSETYHDHYKEFLAQCKNLKEQLQPK